MDVQLKYMGITTDYGEAYIEEDGKGHTSISISAKNIFIAKDKDKDGYYISIFADGDELKKLKKAYESDRSILYISDKEGE